MFSERFFYLLMIFTGVKMRFIQRQLQIVVKNITVLASPLLRPQAFILVEEKKRASRSRNQIIRRRHSLHL